jgi:hypothetical protein
VYDLPKRTFGGKQKMHHCMKAKRVEEKPAPTNC